MHSHLRARSALFIGSLLELLFSWRLPATEVPIFLDGFESASTCAWTLAQPEDSPPGVTCGLASFEPASSFLREDVTSAPTIPEPLTVRLFRPAPEATFVTITADDPALSVAGGGVEVPQAQQEAVVLLNGVEPNLGVTLTASLESVDLQATVRVLGSFELSELVDLTPAEVTIEAGTSTALTVVLDVPAEGGGADVYLQLEPPSAGLVPVLVTVPVDQLTRSFSYQDYDAEPEVWVGAERLGEVRFSHITLDSPVLVISEIDYDQPGTDTQEFVEIFNAGVGNVDLSNFSLVFVNGAIDEIYQTVDLPATELPAGGFFVVCGGTVANCDLDLTPDTNFIQNGSPDAVALVRNVGGTTIHDTVSYEGVTSGYTEGSGAPEDPAIGSESIGRCPAGADTDDNSVDFSLLSPPTPGEPNACS